MLLARRVSAYETIRKKRIGGRGGEPGAAALSRRDGMERAERSSEDDRESRESREGITSDSSRRVRRLSITKAISLHSFSASLTTLSASSDDIVGGVVLVPVVAASGRSVEGRCWLIPGGCDSDL